MTEEEKRRCADCGMPFYKNSNGCKPDCRSDLLWNKYCRREISYQQYLNAINTL